MRRPYYILLAAAIAVVLCYFLLCPYVTPAADDYCRANATRDHGWAAAWLANYNGWDGRYFASLFLYLVPALGDLRTLYPWLPGLLLAASLLTYCCLWSVLLENRLLAVSGLLPGLLLLAVQLTRMPTPMEGFYWFSGAWSYQTGHLLALLALALLWYQPEKIGAQGVSGAAALLAVFAAVGCNESVLCVLLGVLLPGAALAWYWRSPRRIWWVLALGVWTQGAVLVLLAPGNAVRSAAVNEPHNVAAAVVRAWHGASYATGRLWLPDLLWPLLVLLAWPACRRLAARWPRLAAPWLLPAGLAYAGLFLVAALFPAYYVLGRSIPSRTGNVLHLLFLGLGFFLCVLAAARLGPRLPAGLPPRWLVVVQVLAIAALCWSPGFRTAVHDLTVAPLFKEQWQQRFALVELARRQGAAHVILPPVNYPVFPRTICYWDMTDDPDNFTNTCFASFVGLEAVKVTIPAAP